MNEASKRHTTLTTHDTHSTSTPTPHRLLTHAVRTAVGLVSWVQRRSMALYLLFSHMFVILAKFDRVAPAATAPVQRTLSYDGGKREHSQERQCMRVAAVFCCCSELARGD